MKRASAEKSQWHREDRQPTLSEIAWLTGPEGREVGRRMAADEPADTPAAIKRWRVQLPADHVSAAWTQVRLRSGAHHKFSRAAEMVFDRVGLEQSTGERVATYKAGRFGQARRIADLCSGIGGDALALAANHEVVGVDQSEPRAAMARHNAGVYGHRLITQTGDASFDWPDADAVHIDPDRRPTGPRRHDAASGSPGLSTLEAIVAHYRHAAIKLSPGADFHELPFACEIELISDRGECKQAVAWTGDLARAQRRATVLPSGQTLAAAAGESLSWPPPVAPQPGHFLYEPDAAVTRADLVGVLAGQLQLAPVDERIAWLTGGDAISHPMLRTFRILDVRPWSARSARVWLGEHRIGALDVKTRAFAAAPEAILKQLRLTGDRAAVLFLTRLGEKPTAILAERT